MKNFRWKTTIEGEPGQHLQLLRKGCAPRLCPTPAYRADLIQRAHAEAHQQTCGMTKRLVCAYSWYRMREDVKEFVRQCETCQNTNTMVSADREMHAIPVLPKGERWHLDLIGPLTEGIGGYRYAAIAIDSCTKWPEAEALQTKGAEGVEAFFYKEVIARHNVKEVVTDNGSEFQADFQKLVEDFGLDHVRTHVYHPQANGAVERLNQTIKRGLYALSQEHPETWPGLIPRVLRTYRATPQESTGISPAEFMTGKRLPLATMETLAWTPYSHEERLLIKPPQGQQWVNAPVEKIFYNPHSGVGQVYLGQVVKVHATAHQQERLEVRYEDGDSETQEVGNIIPWWTPIPGRTILERDSMVALEGHERWQHLLLTLLSSPPGHLRNHGLSLVKQNVTLKPYLHMRPLMIGASEDPLTSAEAGPSSLTPELTGDRVNLEGLETRGLANIQHAQKKQEAAYRARTRPRNRRVEPFTVGAMCRIQKRTGSRKGKEKVGWSKELYKIVGITDRQVTVEHEGTSEALLRAEVLLVATPIPTQVAADASGGPATPPVV